ncbi:hypothetical protein TNCV_4962641 [Trichonephila clavipes]|nr:hypothetical protein TNCV_4962641 [Trichonephila clavipes]
MANNQSVRRHLDLYRVESWEVGGKAAVYKWGCRVRLLTASFRLWNNFRLLEQLSGGSVVVVPRGTPADDRCIVLQARKKQAAT